MLSAQTHREPRDQSFRDSRDSFGDHNPLVGYPG